MPADEIMMLHRDPFVTTVDQALRTVCGVREGDALLVAVSGGADSLALLRALDVIARRPHWQLRLHVGHVHHHLRAEADADADSVSALARRLDLPFHVEHVEPAEAGGNIESAARRLRYAALQRIADRAGTATVATAHHGDDQLETLLMRLVRGASVRGMSGIAPRRRLPGGASLIRPMLRTDHAAAIAFLQRIGQPWREDVSNTDRSRWRARLRADVLPVLRELRPDAAAKAHDTADRLRDAARLVDQQVRRMIGEHVHATADGRRMPRQAARDMSPALLRSVLRAALIDAGARPDALGRRVLEPLVRTIRDPSGETRHFTIAGGVTLKVDGQHIAWSSP